MKFGTLLFPLALIVATPEAHAQTIDAFSQLEDISYAQVSPDGSKVAIVRPYQGLTAVFVYDLNGAAPKVIPVPENLFVNWLNWASDEHVVITVRVTEELDTVSGLKTYTFTRDFSVNVDNGAFSMMLANNPSLGNALSLSDTVSRLSGNDNAVLMGAYRITNVRNSANSRMTARRGGNTDYKYTLFRVNLSSGSSRAIETFNFDTYSVIATETGDLVARVDHNTDTGLFEILASEGSRWRQIYSREEDAYKTLQPLTVLGLAHDSDTLMVRSFTGEGFRRFQRMATDDGSLTNAPGQPRATMSMLQSTTRALAASLVTNMSTTSIAKFFSTQSLKGGVKRSQRHWEVKTFGLYPGTAPTLEFWRFQRRRATRAHITF